MRLIRSEQRYDHLCIRAVAAGDQMPAAYKTSLLEEAIVRLTFNIQTVILTNLVLGENVVPEFLQRACRPQPLAEGLLSLLGDTPERRRQIDAFARLDAIMEIGQRIPSESAAEVVLRLAAPELADRN